MQSRDSKNGVHEIIDLISDLRHFDGPGAFSRVFFRGRGASAGGVVVKKTQLKQRQLFVPRVWIVVNTGGFGAKGSAGARLVGGGGRGAGLQGIWVCKATS